MRRWENGPLDYAPADKRAALVAELDAAGRPRAARANDDPLAELDRAVAENNAAAARDNERPAATVIRLPPVLARHETRQEEIARLMLDMTYAEFVEMTEGMKVEAKAMHGWAKASVRKPSEA